MTPESLPEVQGDLIYASKHGFNLETVFTIQIDNNHWLPGSESIGYNLSGSPGYRCSCWNGLLCIFPSCCLPIFSNSSQLRYTLQKTSLLLTVITLNHTLLSFLIHRSYFPTRPLTPCFFLDPQFPNL